MRRLRRLSTLLLGLGVPLLATGCGSGPADTPAAAAAGAMFGPTGMRIHPIFTQVASWTHGPKPDGIEAHLEFEDQFHDPTKASGQVLFELFEFRRDARGKRVGGPWVGSLATPDEQREKWMPTLRTYQFHLAYPAVSADKSYVLTATFEVTGGRRFPIDQIVLQGRKADDVRRGKGGIMGRADPTPGPRPT